MLRSDFERFVIGEAHENFDDIRGHLFPNGDFSHSRFSQMLGILLAANKSSIRNWYDQQERAKKTQ